MLRLLQISDGELGVRFSLPFVSHPRQYQMISYPSLQIQTKFHPNEQLLLNYANRKHDTLIQYTTDKVNEDQMHSDDVRSTN